MVEVYSSFCVDYFSLSSLYTNPFFRITEFVVGINLGLIWKEKALEEKIPQMPKFQLIAGFVILLIGVSLISKHLKYENSMMYSWFAVPCSAFIIYISAWCEPGRYTIRIFRYGGALSYAFFLAQLFSNTFSKVLIRLFGITSNFPIVILGWLSCFVIAVCLHHFIESPVREYLLKRVRI